MSCAGIAAHSVSSEVSAHQISQQSEQQLQKRHPGAYSEVDGEGVPKPLAAPLASTKLLRQLPPYVEAPFSTTAAAGNSNLVMSVLCRGKTSASSRRLRQCVSHTKSPFIQPAQSFDEAVDVPVVLHDRQKAMSSTGPVHWQDRRFLSCVATPSTNNPDDTAKVLRMRQRQSTTNQEIQKIAEVPQDVQRQCTSPNDPECRADPTGPILDRITVAPVGIQRQTPTIQSPQQPLKVTQTHFLIQWQVSRLAGSSDTQNVCRMTKSRNRTGSRAWRKSSAYRPPAHAVANAGADSKDTEVHSAAQADESLTKSAFPKVEVLYVVMGCSETSVLSTRRCRGAKPLAVAAAAFEKTLRRLCSRLLRQRQDFEWSNSLQRCFGRPLCFLNGHHH